MNPGLDQDWADFTPNRSLKRASLKEKVLTIIIALCFVFIAVWALTGCTSVTTYVYAPMVMEVNGDSNVVHQEKPVGIDATNAPETHASGEVSPTIPLLGG